MGQPGCRDFFPYHVSTNALKPSRFLLWESPHFGTPSHSLSEVAAQRNTNETGLPPLWRPRVPAAWFIFWPQESAGLVCLSSHLVLKVLHPGSRIWILRPKCGVGGLMPRYEYFCHACKRVFSKVLTITEYEEGKITCPHCGSKEVEQSWSAFYAITSKKSA